jgi:hypothetical protein
MRRKFFHAHPGPRNSQAKVVGHFLLAASNSTGKAAQRPKQPLYSEDILAGQ